MSPGAEMGVVDFSEATVRPIRVAVRASGSESGRRTCLHSIDIRDARSEEIGE